MNKHWIVHQAGRDRDGWYRSAYVTHDCPTIESRTMTERLLYYNVTAQHWTCTLCNEEMPKDIRVAWALLVMNTTKGHPK